MFGKSLTSILCVLAVAGLGYAQVPTATPVTDPAAGTVLSTNEVYWPTSASRENQRVWASAEYLLWWIERGPLPIPLVTTTSDLTNPRRGAIDLASTTVIYGGEGINFSAASGGRFTLGAWLDEQNTIGVEGSGFLLERRSRSFAAGSQQPGGTPLYVPLFRPELGTEGTFIISDPTLPASGAIVIDNTTRLWGMEYNGVVNLDRNGNGFHLDGLFGFRYMQLDEDLTLNAAINSTPLDFQVLLQDRFATTNYFYGGQVGVRTGFRWNGVDVDLIGKLALGDTHQTVNANGIINQTGAVAAAGGNLGISPGGLLTQPTNMGVFSRDRFGVIPEVGIKGSIFLTETLRASFGYNFLYWNDVVRPGNEIDRSVNRTQQGGGALVGPANPAPLFNSSNFWTQGLTFGLELRF